MIFWGVFSHYSDLFWNQFFVPKRQIFEIGFSHIQTKISMSNIFLIQKENHSQQKKTIFFSFETRNVRFWNQTSFIECPVSYTALDFHRVDIEIQAHFIVSLVEKRVDIQLKDLLTSIKLFTNHFPLKHCELYTISSWNRLSDVYVLMADSHDKHEVL